MTPTLNGQPQCNRCMCGLRDDGRYCHRCGLERQPTQCEPDRVVEPLSSKYFTSRTITRRGGFTSTTYQLSDYGRDALSGRLGPAQAATVNALNEAHKAREPLGTKPAFVAAVCVVVLVLVMTPAIVTTFFL